MATVEFTRTALDEVGAIADYTRRNWGPARANEYAEGLFDKCRQLASQPALGHAVEEHRAGYRRCRYRSHFIYYRRIAAGIEVMGVIHVRQDPKRRFRSP